MHPVALITGASRGIGRGIALALSGAGYDLVLDYAVNSTAAAQTAADCLAAGRASGHAIRAECFQADVADSAARAALVDFTRKTYGRIDLLVNNAGVAPHRRVDLLEADEAGFDRLMNINVKGPYFLTQRVAQWMIAQQTGATKDVPPPKIVTISSLSAYTASVTRGDYCISKAALSMLTPLFAARLADHGIRVFEIRPGIIATDMTQSVRDQYNALIAKGLTPIRRWGTPADVAHAVLAIAQDAFPFSTGEVINVDGGFHLRVL